MQSVEIDSESQSTVEITTIMGQCYVLWGVALQMLTVSFCDNFLQAYDVPLSSAPAGLSLLTNLQTLVVGVVS